MTLGTCQAPGLIRQSAGAEAFSYVRTLQQLGGTRQLPSINASASVGLLSMNIVHFSSCVGVGLDV